MTLNLRKVANLWIYILESSLNRRWLWYSSTQLNDCPKLELSGAWELSDSPFPLPSGEGQEAYFGLPYGNQSNTTEGKFSTF